MRKQLSITQVLMPLLYTLWKYQQTNNPGIDFCINTKAGNVIECGVTQLQSGGVILSRTLYRKGDPGSAYTDLTKFDLPGLVSWVRNACNLGGRLSPGTYEDQSKLAA